jgi:hypothetical protein
MELPETAKAIAQVLAPALPFLLDIGKVAKEKASEALGASVWEGAKRLWERMTGRGAASEAVVVAAREVALAPEDEDAAGAFRLQLRKLLAADPALVAETEPIVRQLQQIQAIQVHVTGSGAAAVGPSATAGGAGSVVISGSVGGNVNLGGRKSTEGEGDE